MFSTIRGTMLPGLMALACCALGCTPSVWEESFVRNPDAATAALRSEAPVRVRFVPWERMSATLHDLNQQVVASSVHPDDWTPDEKLAAKTRLLNGLQVSEPPADIDVVGRAEFRTTDGLRPDGTDQPELAAFARTVGATDVVWSSRDLGKAQKIIDRPVTTYSTGTFWGDSRDRRRGWWSDGYTYNSTTWVPVTVEARETGFYAYFLRMR